MFQNIQDVHEGLNYNNEKRKTKLFSNILSKKNIMLYIIVFMISTIGMGQDMSLFSLAITAACISAGIPVFGVVAFGVIGNAVTFGATGVLNYVITLLVFIISMFIFKPVYNEENRNEKLKISFNLFIAVLLIEIIKIVFSQFTMYDALMAVTISILSIVFYKIFVNSIAVIQEFSERNAFSIEEVIGASLLLAIAFSALGDFSVFGFSIRNILSILIVLTLGWKNGMLVGTTSGVVVGVTLGIIANTEPIMIAAYAISGMIAGILNRFGKIGVIVGFMVGAGILAYISNGATSELILFKEILIASIGLLAMPRNISINIEPFSSGIFLPVSPSGTLTRSQEKEAVDKLNNVSSALKDIANTYKSNKNDNEFLISNRNIFIAELLNQLDSKKDNILYDDITKTDNKITEELFNILLNKQKITRSDLLDTFARFNSFIVESEDNEISEYLEKNIDEIVTCVNNAYKISKSNFILQKKLDENKKNMSVQLSEVSKAISNVAQDIVKEIKSENKYEIEKRKILTFMAQSNIQIEDIRIKKEKNGRFIVDIYPAIREITDDQKEKINKIIDTVFKQQMTQYYNLNNGVLSYISADRYMISIGKASVMKSGNTISGDSILKVRLQDGKFLIAISDGMGAGEEANKSSRLALNMLEKLLESGFDKDTSVELINSTILNGSEQEMFATLDIAIIDLYSGNIEFLKSGACPTYIKNRRKINLVKSVSLPAGIVNNADLSLYDKDIESGDILVMCSDGILDSNVEYKNKELWVKYLLEDIETDDAQKIADLVINEAIDNSYGIVKDDMSICVCKFTKK